MQREELYKEIRQIIAQASAERGWLKYFQHVRAEHHTHNRSEEVYK